MKPKISVYIASSLDGFIARKNGDLDWLTNGNEPLKPLDDPEIKEDYGYREFINSVDVLVMGRKTFEKALAFGEWPYKDKNVVVLSTGTPSIPDSLRDIVTVMSMSPKDLVEYFSGQGVTHLYVDGGNTIQRFIAAGLVDEMTITRIPVLIGEGVLLFGTLDKDVKLAHVFTRPFENGYVQSKYRFTKCGFNNSYIKFEGEQKMNCKLFSPAKLGVITLKNHIVMSPMTRSRAINNIPNDLMAEYYGQRAGAGLIITEGTSPSPNGLGYARIPGVYSQEQVIGWKKITGAVHAKGGKIFLQIMHTGRISHKDNMPASAVIMAPSAIAANGEMWTDNNGMQNQPIPKEMTKDDISKTKEEFVLAAKNALEAGFDGVELHSANGYLLDQFLNPGSNQRKDDYGGSVENRCRFVLEVAEATVKAIGKEKIGIRLSPYGAFNDLKGFEETDPEYSYLSERLNALGLVYMHLVDHSSMGAPKVEPVTVEKIRNNFKGTLILSGGYDKERAEKDLQSGAGDLIAFGRHFISNPDLVFRLENGIALAAPDMNTFYTPGKNGYTDYPFAS